MTIGAIIELVAAVALIVGGIVLYRRRSPEDGQYGSQSGVLLIVIGIIVAIHGLGGLDYRPSPAESAR